ncbi:MAG: HNH endonuclease signature motif containing protein [Leptospirales bacterium]
MIAVYEKMINGLEFKRALSASDMSYYLARIMTEDSSSSLLNSVNALWKHIEYYEAKNNVTLKSLRDLHSSYLAISQGIVSFEDSNKSFDKSFDKAVEKALKTPKEERQKILSTSNKTPQVRAIVANVYERNPYVVAEILERASGKCERCDSSAPFARKKDNSPYLEVHHKVRLADGGEDTVQNATALCPNCHRELHFGVPKHNKALHRISR